MGSKVKQQKATVLFCPFCGESYEGQVECPVHELKLIPWEQLPKPEVEIDPNAELPWHCAQYGRAWMVAGVALMGLGFVLPMVAVQGSAPYTLSALRLAGARATNLWTVPLAAGVIAYLWYRKRSQVGMRGLRIVMPFVAFMALLSVVYTARGVVAWSNQTGQAIHWGVGIWVIACGALVVMVRGLKYGQ